MITTKELWDDALRRAAVAEDELHRRLAVDALYYPIFLSVRRRVDVRRGNDPAGEHVLVIQKLQALGHIEQRAGLRLDSLRKLRNKAKYDIGLTVTPRELVDAQRHAENILALLPSLIDQN